MSISRKDVLSCGAALLSLGFLSLLEAPGIAAAAPEPSPSRFGSRA